MSARDRGASSRRVVLIDPVAETREVFAKRLRAIGFVVEEAADAVVGAETALADPPVAIVSDLWMPGVSGLQLCRLLCAEPATVNVPVILRSDSDNPNDRFWARHAGASALVMKGRMGELVRTLGDVLDDRKRDDDFFFAVSGGGQSQIRDRIAEYLDRALFASVVEGEVRALSNASSFAAMFDSLSQLLTQLIDYRWLAVSTTSPAYFAVHAHRRQMEDAARDAAQALGVAEGGRTVRIQDDDALDVTEVEQTVICDLSLGGAPLGQLAIGIVNGSAEADGIAHAVARELASVVKLVLLVEESQRLATLDGLTGLKNRRAFLQELGREHARAIRTATPLSFLLLDLDHFKAINDTHGHGAGDAVLVAVGRALHRSVRTHDCVGRWGGEEFVVALPSTTRQAALQVAERLRATIADLDVRDATGQRIPLSASLGVARLETTPAPEGLEALIDRADRAMYNAKLGGRNRVCSSTVVASVAPETQSIAASA